MDSINVVQIALYKGVNALFFPTNDKNFNHAEYPTGEILIELCEIEEKKIFNIVEENPYKNNIINEDTLNKTLDWLRVEMSALTPAQYSFLYNGISKTFSDYLKNPKEYTEQMGLESNHVTDIIKLSLRIFNYELLKAKSIMEIFSQIDSPSSIEGATEKSKKEFLELFTDIPMASFQHISVFYTMLDFDIIPIYSFDGVYSFLVFELSNIIEHNVIIKKCENCGRFFIPKNRRDEKYCSNTSPQDEKLTCKQYGSKKLWYEKVKNNETKRLARSIYSAKQMLVSRNPDIEKYKENFEQYKNQLKQWKSDVKNGVKSETDYLEWLKAVKEKKVL